MRLTAVGKQDHSTLLVKKVGLDGHAGMITQCAVCHDSMPAAHWLFLSSMRTGSRPESVEHVRCLLATGQQVDGSLAFGKLENLQQHLFGAMGKDGVQHKEQQLQYLLLFCTLLLQSWYDAHQEVLLQKC